MSDTPMSTKAVTRTTDSTPAANTHIALDVTPNDESVANISIRGQLSGYGSRSIQGTRQA